MSLFNRRVFLAGLAVLPACGFTPAYAPGATGSALQNAVFVNEPASRETFLLVQRLEERLGAPTLPRYDLAVNLTTTTAGLGIDPAGDTLRFNTIGTAGYVLTDRTTGAQLTSGTVNSFTGYSASDSTVATLASERDSVERLMVIIADQIVARLLSVDLP